MTAIDSSTRAVASGDDVGEIPVDEAHLAAAAFLARYRARTLEAYRYDLRVFFQWAADHGLEVLAAARHADPRTTVGYDHRRQNFDKHAAYVVVAFVAGG